MEQERDIGITPSVRKISVLPPELLMITPAEQIQKKNTVNAQVSLWFTLCSEKKLTLGHLSD
jgi:hypothetical protein